MGDLREPVGRELAMRRRSELHACSQELDGQLAELKQLRAEGSRLESELEAASKRHNNLQSGRGYLIDSFGPIAVHEFWIQVPGYSGPIKNASADIIVHGDVQTVGEVTSKQKSGVGGFIAGGVLLGPAGAIGGALLSRKNEIKTTMREIDNRKLELQVRGPGFAWSKVYPITDELRLRKIRDNIISLGSNEISCEQATAQNEDLGRSLKKGLSTNARNQAALETLVSVTRERFSTIRAACSGDSLSAPVKLRIWWMHLPPTVKSNAIFLVRFYQGY
jgi:hypothetical protein